MQTQWTVKPFYTPQEGSDPLGVFEIEEVKAEAEKWEDASMDASPHSEQEQHAIDKRGEVTERAARLIAAAPELLAALKDMLHSFETGEHYETRNPYSRPYVQAALAAITKAEGREE